MSYNIDDKVVEEVKSRMDIVELISEYVELKKSGRNYMGRCPFHQERTPSFSVNGENQFFHCFGCGAGGDGITFIMKKENLDFVEAVTFLCEKYGIPLEEKSEEGRRQSEYRKRIFEINRKTARFFMVELSKNRYALEYLKNRGITVDIIYKYGLGFAPNQGRALTDSLLKEGFSEKELLDANVTSQSQKNGNYFDRFRNRIMFPILDTKGRVLGFGGRVMSKENFPKYLNTGETPVFHKGSHLYGLHIVAKESDRQKILLVEGYMDVIGLYQGGIPYGVASLGTALTQEQAALVKRYGKTVYICYDGDDAGIRATNRGIDILLEQNISPKIVVLPDNLDPDEYIRKYGTFAFESQMTKAVGHVEFRIGQVKKNFSLSTPQGRADFLRETAKILMKIPSPIERDVYKKRIAETYEISEQALTREMETMESRPKKARGVERIPPKPRVLELGALGAQRHLVAYGLHQEDFYKKIKDFMKEEYWRNPEYKEVFTEGKKPEDSFDYLRGFVDQGVLTYRDLEEIRRVPIDDVNGEALLEECFLVLEQDYLNRRIQQLLKEISDMSEEGKDGELYEKMAELKDLNRRKKMKGVGYE